jgi:hypothetical protein
VFELAEGSIQLWFNTRNANDKQTLFSKDDQGRNMGLEIGLHHGDLQVRLETAAGKFVIDTHRSAFDNLIRSRTWYQLTFTFGNGGMKLYLNGVLVGSNGYTGGLAENSDPIVIGGSGEETRDGTTDLSKLKITDPFDGHIDEVAVFAAALTPEQIAQSRQRGAMGVIDPDDLGTIDGTDTLISVERIEFSDGTPVLTAGPAASGEVDVTPVVHGAWGGRWEGLAELLASLRHHDVREFIGELKERGLKLFGHTSAKPALFSIEGVELDEDGCTAYRAGFATKAAQHLDGWILYGKKGEHAAEHDKVKARDEPAAVAKQTAKTIDWNASFQGVGAALTSGKPGARGESRANFAAFEKQSSQKKSGR